MHCPQLTGQVQLLETPGEMVDLGCSQLLKYGILWVNSQDPQKVEVVTPLWEIMD